MSNQTKASPVQFHLPFDSLSTGKEQGKLYQNRAWLYQKYWIEGLCKEEIAKLHGCGETTIGTWLKKCGIKIRTLSEAQKIVWNRPEMKNKGIKFNKDKSWICQKYIKNKLSAREIGDICEVSDECILFWLKKYGIKRRSAGESISAYTKRNPKPYMIKKDLYQKYIIEKKSTTELGIYYNCCSGTIWKWLKKHNIPIRTQSEWMKEYYKTHSNPMLGRCGKDNPNFGRKLNKKARENISKGRMKSMKRFPSEEQKERQRQKVLGKNNYFYGKKHSRKTRRKMKKGWKRLWNDETRRKQFQKNSSEAHKGNSSPIKGKTYEEVYGMKKANKMKKRMSENLKGKFTMEKNPAWLGGKSFEPYGQGFNDKLKCQIRKRDDFKCQYCGIKENSRAHDCHHVDSDKKNNNPQNLILLCVNCHSATKGSKANQEQWQNYFENTMNKKEYGLDF